MRAEDKAIDRDLVHALGRRAVVASADESVEEHLLDGAAVASAEVAPRAHLAYDAVERLLRGEALDAAGLAGLSRDERRALELLEEARGGKDVRTAAMIYAEDRRDLLEQALAVLQPLLAAGHDPAMATLRERHAALVEDVVELRTHLEGLADAQDAVVRGPEEVGAAKDGDDGDEDEDEDEHEHEHEHEHGDGDGDGGAA